VRSRSRTGPSRQHGSSSSSAGRQPRRSHSSTYTKTFLSKTISSLFILGCHTSPPSECTTKSLCRMRRCSPSALSEGVRWPSSPTRPPASPPHAGRALSRTLPDRDTSRPPPLTAGSYETGTELFFAGGAFHKLSHQFQNKVVLLPFYSFLDTTSQHYSLTKPRKHTNKGTGKLDSTQWTLELFFCKIGMCDMNEERPSLGQTFLHQGHRQSTST